MQQLLKQVEQGATVLTASHRLARVLLESFTRYQRDRGRAVWETPKIYSWNAFLQDKWQDAMLLATDAAPILLNSAQEAAVWEDIIRESPAGRTLLRVPETARSAMDAWRLIHAYRVPFSKSDFSGSDDCEAFFGWANEFAARLETHGWSESARVSDLVADLVRQGRLERPFPLLLAGFDELTPQQQDLLDAYCGSNDDRLPDLIGTSVTTAFRDTTEEIRAAARWTRLILEGSPAAQIGIVVPNLAGARQKVERIFGELLQPGEVQPDRPAFHLSLGAPLTQHPIIHTALQILDLVTGALPAERIGMLLRSPFVKGADEERAARARLDSALRRHASLLISIDDIRRESESESCLVLRRILNALERDIRKLPSEQYPSLWGRTFSRLLKLAGWPGAAKLESAQYQAVKAWNGVLSTLASLDSVTVRLSAEAALLRLRKLAENTPFQAENEGAPVQILGLLEASGLRFDHLWVMGLHDQAMPPTAHPHPFLPLHLQRELGLPHCSAERELAFSEKQIARLKGSAPRVVLSYPQWEGDQPLTPSPLIGRRGTDFEVPRGVPDWVEAIRASSRSESIQDSAGTPLSHGAQQRGGTSMLKDMAACPFRAYAQHRLGARPLEEPVLGINPKEKGSTVHTVLELLWTELKTHANLCSLSPEQEQGLINRSIAAAIKNPTGLGWILERKRIARLLTEWLELERKRPPFQLLGTEQKQEVEIGGLMITTRIDRVDELPDGRRVILDYKTGKLNSGAWSGDRPEEPQVPLYCASGDQHIAAAAFAQIKSGSVQFLGVSQNGEIGVMKEMRLEKGARMEEHLEAWLRALGKLAEEFRAGLATVDPKSRKSCEYCRVTPLCRINDADLAPAVEPRVR